MESKGDGGANQDGEGPQDLDTPHANLDLGFSRFEDPLLEKKNVFSRIGHDLETLSLKQEGYQDLEVSQHQDIQHVS